MNGWPTFRLDDAALAEYRQCGTGLLCGELVGLDIDVLHEEAAAELHDLARRELGGGPCRSRPGAEVCSSPIERRGHSASSRRDFLIDGQSHQGGGAGRRSAICRLRARIRTLRRPTDGWTATRSPSRSPICRRSARSRSAAFIDKAEAVLARYGVPQKPDRMNGTEPPREHHTPPSDDPARRAYVEAALADEVKAVATASRGGRNAV